MMSSVTVMIVSTIMPMNNGSVMNVVCMAIV